MAKVLPWNAGSKSGYSVRRDDRREAVKGQASRLWLTETIQEEYMKLMDNQSVAAQCSGTLKGAAVACAVAGAVLPWLGALSRTGLIPGIALGVAGILLAVASVACAIAALCRKSVVFGIVMIFAGLVACGIAESGAMYLMFKHGEEPPMKCSKQVGEGISVTWSLENQKSGEEKDR